MWMNNRMKLAIEALSIFIRSLPVDCKFSVIGFGSYFQFLVGKDNNELLSYTNESRDHALAQIKTWEPDMGGTDILQPLSAAQDQANSGQQKRIFLLTDGDVDDPQSTISKAREKNSTCRVFSFGLGDGCDT